MPQPTKPTEDSLRDVFHSGRPHLKGTDGDWGLPFVLRLMFARWP
jgi:hypothetical protein